VPQTPGLDDSRGARAWQGSHTVDRARYLVTDAEHAALAAALRLPRRRVRPAPSPAGRLRVAVLSAFPASHLGTISRFTRWVPHLAPLGCDLAILTPCSDQTFAAFGRGDSCADRRYYHECLVNLRDNLHRAAAADVVVLHRGLLPFSPWQRPTFERALARMNPRLVYDFYDAIWLQRQAASHQRSRVGRCRTSVSPSGHATSIATSAYCRCWWRSASTRHAATQSARLWCSDGSAALGISTG
jgi:hypothetical protein